MAVSLLISTLLLALGLLVPAAHAATKPNIVIVVADDLGYTDCGFHGGDQVPTPHLDFLAHEGIMLENYYTAMICTPSRASLLTGRHPMQLGLHDGVIYAGQPFGLQLNETLLPQYLKKYGYSTHAVGKWHLGCFQGAYTPTNRGFDTHFGFWNGKTDYFSHNTTTADLGEEALDFWENMTVAWGYNNSYGTELFGNRAVDLIENHDQSKPFFLYLAHQAVHNGIEPQPLKAPQEYLDKFKFIKHDGRRRYAAMLSVLDDSIGNLTKALIHSGMYNNTILLFTTDNGGPVNGSSLNWASNYPLRGSKYTNWEGGVRGVAFLHSPLIKRKGKSKQLMHISDWLPTFLSAIGESPQPSAPLYGVDQWKALTLGLPSARTELLHNFWNDSGAIRQENWKLVIVGHSCCTHSMSRWYPEQQYTSNKQAYIDCGAKNYTACTVKDKYCLFDVETDPCEYDNVAATYPEIAAQLYNKLMWYNATAQPPRNKPFDKRALPSLHNWHWTDWLDPHPIN